MIFTIETSYIFLKIYAAIMTSAAIIISNYIIYDPETSQDHYGIVLKNKSLLNNPDDLSHLCINLCINTRGRYMAAVILRASMSH